MSSSKTPPNFSPKKATLSKPEEVALNIIRKQLGGVNDMVQAELEKVRKETADTTKRSHTLLMHALDQITKLTHSRLLDATYLRKASLRDPSLDEKGCQALAIYGDAFTNLTKALASLAKKIEFPNMDVDVTPQDINCGRMDSCSLDTKLNAIFENVNWAIVTCCPRHQRILESDYKVQIVSTTVIQIPVSEVRNGKECKRAGPVTYINLVRNGVLF